MRGNRLAAASGFILLAPWLVCAAACSSDSGRGKGTGSAGDGGPGTGGAGQGSGATGSGASQGTAASDGAGGLLLGVGTNGGNAGQSPDGTSCAQVVRKGETVPLDMYILLDKSSSMLDTTGAGPTKWDAISSALESFVNASSSAGLGVGLQYFPLLKPGVPGTCTSHAECGVGSPCFLTSCDNTGTVTPCVTDTECGRNGHCIPFGVCERYPVGGSPEFCSPIGTPCMGPLGNCIDVPDRWCVNGTECTQTAYSTPAVAIAPLPANAQKMMASIDATVPEGRTPTAPALQGAVTEAGTWAKANPGHRVVAVLATDGLPTECTPTDIGPVAAFASTGLAATPSISTFVIGVFGPDDTDSPTNLDTIAKAGGTNKAFIVDTSGDVNKQFQAALDAIRGSALVSCDFQVPASTGSAMLDFNKVNLEVTFTGGKQQQLVYVDDDAGCAGAANPAWHYDVQPTAGAPTRIIVCPNACSTIKADTGAVVNLQIGCKQSIR